MKDSNKTEEGRSQKSITVRVKLSDFLSKLTPENDFDISVPAACTVAEFIEYLVKRLGDEFRRTLLDKDGRLHAGYAIMQNKHFIAPQRLTEFKILDNTEIRIVPIVGGG